MLIKLIGFLFIALLAVLGGIILCCLINDFNECKEFAARVEEWSDYDD